MRRQKRKGYRWSRQAPDRRRRLNRLRTVSHYTYDANDAGPWRNSFHFGVLHHKWGSLSWTLNVVFLRCTPDPSSLSRSKIFLVTKLTVRSVENVAMVGAFIDLGLMDDCVILPFIRRDTHLEGLPYVTPDLLSKREVSKHDVYVNIQAPESAWTIHFQGYRSMAQQTVKLIRGQSVERFTIADELLVSLGANNQHNQRDKPQKTPKKAAAGLASSKSSFDLVDHWQKSVEEVLPPPDAQQESYVCDEEDLETLKIFGAKKRFAKHGIISVGAFEDAVTQLERESTKCRGVSTNFNLPVDEDAVCSVCQRGDCDNTNMILFCDICNLAVHQECYGVPYIPEGQWHCRRCMMPTGNAQCQLCPNSEGALKQTEDGHWAHVICAMYMPRVNFKSLQLLEPIMNIDKIEKSRWQLKCAVCKAQPNYRKELHMGACIQCEEAACKTAFHVTCAQKAGYYMEWKPVKDDEDTSRSRERDSSPHNGIKALAFCEKHSRLQPERKDPRTFLEKSARSSGIAKANQQNRMDSLNLDPEKLRQIAASVDLQSKPVLFNLIISYWKSKRQHRNGLPLLKRPKGKNIGAQRAVNYEELERSRAVIKVALRTAEKLRTLTEYKLRQDKTSFRKDKLWDVKQCFDVMPGKAVLDHVFVRIKSADKDSHFAIPVTEKIAPLYLSIISHPMDLSTMKKKLEEGRYGSFEEFENDVQLIISNCLKYNTPDTFYHQYALTFRNSVNPMLDIGRVNYKEFVEMTRSSTEELLSLSVPTSPISSVKLPRDSPTKEMELRKFRDDFLSEISAAEDDEAMNSIHPLRDLSFPPEILPCPMEVATPTTSAASSAVNSHSPSSSRAIPSSPQSRKIPAASESHPDDSNEADSGPARKRLRTTPGDSEEVTSPSNEVPAAPSALTPAHPGFLAYRPGRLIALASESEPDPPFASEDSTDLPTSDYDAEQDGPANRLRRKSRTATFHREYLEIKTGDFVWAKLAKTSYPALVVDPRAHKGYAPSNGIACPPIPPDVLAERKAVEKKLPGSFLLVNFFNAKRNWLWVQRDKLDLMIIDPTKDKSKLNEPRKLSERKNVKKAYELALKFVDIPSSFGSNSPPVDRSSPMETDADEV